ncbi:MAG: periplasmic heavy metal sensor [Proteobacteria bacterium]|nr:periplasmic heavy metal sensor [Pseudomonadota bacterium]
MKKKMIKAGLIFTVLLSATYALAFRGAGAGAGCMGFQGNGFCTAVLSIPDLTADQKSTITSLKDDFYKDSQTLRDEIDSKQLELKNLMEAETLDKNKIFATQEDLSELNQKLQKSALTFHVSVSEILTPDQRKTIGPANCPLMGGAGGQGYGCGKGYHGGPGKGAGMGTKCPRL